jgi:hypothetical protein
MPLPKVATISPAEAVSSTATFHTHIDCSRGLSARAIYQACRELAKEMLPLRDNDAVTTTETVLRNTLKSLGLILLTSNSKNKDRGGDPYYAIEQHEKWIAILQQNRDHQHHHQDQPPQSQLELADAVSVAANDQHEQEMLSWLVLESTCEALTLASSRLSVNESMHEKPYSVIPVNDSDAFAIVGSIWWFHRLGIHCSISCSPIPCSTSLLAKNPSLLKDMFVQLVNDESSAVVITQDGLAILRVLLLTSSGTTSDASICRRLPPPMMLRFHTAGGEGGTMIVVGELLNTTTVVATNSNCSNHSGQLDSNHIEQTKCRTTCGLERLDLWDVDRNLSLVETNIDDMTAEHLAFAMEMLIQHESVADCWITPIIMKKGRGAQSLHCLCRNEQCSNVLQLIFKHCTTLGVRVRNHETGLSRISLRRSMVTVPITLPHPCASNDILLAQPYTVNCKIAYLGADTIVSIKAEFDQCRRISLATGGDVSLEQISERAIQRARDMIHASSTEGSRSMHPAQKAVHD